MQELPPEGIKFIINGEYITLEGGYIFYYL